MTDSVNQTTAYRALRLPFAPVIYVPQQPSPGDPPLSGTPSPAAPATTKASLIDAAVKASNDLPSLVASLQQIDPGLATQIGGKTAAASSTIWGHLILLGVGALVAKYGINWDSSFQVEIAGGILLGAQALWGIASRFWTKAPISGIVSAPNAKAAALAALLLPVGLSACKTAPITTTVLTAAEQAAFAAEQAYTVAAHGEAAFAAAASTAQIATMKQLDAKAYADVVAIRAAAAAGQAVDALVTQFQTDLAPLTALINGGKS